MYQVIHYVLDNRRHAPFYVREHNIYIYMSVCVAVYVRESVRIA